MRQYLLAATALTTTVLFMVPGALAQGAPAFNWTGFYAGAEIGGAEGNTAIDFSNLSPSSASVPMLGATGTITLGANMQSGPFVYGIAVDGTLLSLKGTNAIANGTANAALDRLFSLRGRFGATSGPMLFFATAGVAAGHETFSTDVSRFPGSSPAAADGYVYGPTFGGGVEVALNDKVSLTAEGVVTKLGSLTATGDTGKGSYTATAAPTTLNVRTGLNIHF